VVRTLVLADKEKEKIMTSNAQAIKTQLHRNS